MLYPSELSNISYPFFERLLVVVRVAGWVIDSDKFLLMIDEPIDSFSFVILYLTQIAADVSN